MNQPRDAVVFDKADFMERVEGDMELARDLAALFIDDAAEKLNDMRRGIDQKDGQSIDKAAHSLKGASANLSAIRLRDLASDLEQAGKARDISRAADIFKDIELALRDLEAALKDQILRSGD